MKYLLLISLCCAACLPTRQVTESIRQPAFDSRETTRYQVTIQVRQALITGIMIVKHARDEWRGSLINEFGVKAFDFIVNGERCRVLNAISFLDRWYIRRVIASDITLLCGGRARKGKYLESLPGGGFLLKNEKHHIIYTFKPVNP
ncbi:MAG: hypothetical protein LBD64_06570 [Odoribacteraceae bacterium]|nr:hypothetical protein [Odoribacteraceae bacterium]